VDGADAPAFTAPAARARRANRGTDRLRDKRRRKEDQTVLTAKFVETREQSFFEGRDNPSHPMAMINACRRCEAGPLFGSGEPTNSLVVAPDV
jgi:hypothetical protein